MDGPSLIVWTQHALAKAERERFVPSDVEDALLDHHTSANKTLGRPTGC